MRNTPCKKAKKGFSLMEVIIAMAVISIVFAIAMTSIAATAKARLRAFQSKYCVSEISNLLECYKIDGGENFENNVSTYLGVALFSNGETKSDDNGGYTEYVIYYNSNFEKLESQSNHVYRLVAKIYTDGISAQMIQVKSETDAVIFEMEKYQSRYDLVGGGGA